MAHTIKDKRIRLIRKDDFLKSGKLNVEYTVEDGGLSKKEMVEVDIIDVDTLSTIVDDAVNADYDKKYGGS